MDNNSPDQSSSGISVKTKIIVLVLVCIIAVVVYLVYTKKNKPNTSPGFTNSAIPQKIQDALNKISPSKTYLYSDKNFNKDATGKLYMKDKDGNFWDCGMGEDCLILTTSATPIQNVYKFYNCADVPDKYKAQCAMTPGDKTKFISVLVMTAKDYEDFIQKNLSGKYTPDLSECVYSSGPGEGESIAEIIGNKFVSLGEYLWSRKDQILELANTIGTIEAASHVLGHYAIIFFLLPSILSGTPAQQLKAGVMGGQVAIQQLLQWGIGKSSELLAARTAEEEADIIADSGGELFTATMSSITKTAGQLSLEALNISAVFLSKLMEWAGFFQQIGMVLDALDPCGLSGNTMNQDILNNLKKTNDLTLSTSSGAMSYPSVWDASMMCDYQLNNNFFWQHCMSESDKAKTTEKDFCQKDNDDYNKYYKEYLDNLTVNSNGQNIAKKGGGLDNNMLQKIFEDNVPGVDWSAIGKIQPSDIRLPTNKSLRQLDLLFTDQNVILASYVERYWWLFLVFFIFILILVFIF